MSHAEGLAAHPTRMGSSSSPKDARPARTSPGAPGALQPQAALSRLRNNSILTQVPVLWAHQAVFGHRGPPPQMRLLRTAPVLVSPCGIARCEEPGLEPACTLSTSGSLLPCPGAPEHPHGMHQGTSCALGATPRGTTRPPFLGAEGSTRSRPSSVQGSRMPALPCPQAAFSLPLSPERIRAQSRMGPKNSSTSSGWDSALQRLLKLSTAPLGLPRASGARTGPSPGHAGGSARGDHCKL